MIVIKDFSKTYNGKTIVAIKLLELSTGIYRIEGKNGSGKSTLFKAMSGIIPFEGDCLIQHISVKKQPVAYRKILNYCDAEPIFPGFLTLKDLVIFIGGAKNAPINQQQYLVDHFGMAPFINQAIGTYSTGMLKKTALIFAFLGNPNVIILDEPFAALDHDTIHILTELIQKLHHSKDTTFLISSHIKDTDSRLSYTKTFLLHDTHLSG